MKCPKCQQNLFPANYKGIQVDKCTNCGGLWFDVHELDKLEDTVFESDHLKGTLAWNKKQTHDKCPKCTEDMIQFDYRFNNLHLEYCEKHMHGFWLDKGEEERIVDEMKETVEGLNRKHKAEEEWTDTLKHLTSPSFFNTIRKLLDKEITIKL